MTERCALPDRPSCVWRLGIFAMFVATLIGCAGDSKREERTSTVAAGVTSQSVQLQFPVGVDSNIALAAMSGSLSVDGLNTVDEPDTTPSPIAQLGGLGIVNIGAGSSVGAITAQGAVGLAVGSTVTGNIESGGLVAQPPGAVVHGTVTSLATLTPFVTETWPVEQADAPTHPVLMVPSQNLTLAPGSYGVSGTAAFSNLKLTAGTYGFTSLNIVAASTLTIDDSAGPVRVYVQNGFAFTGTVVTPSGAPPALLVVQVGPLPITLATPFRGTLVAPSATVTVKAGPQAHEGSVLAQTVELCAGASLIHRPYFRIKAAPTWSVSASGSGATAGPFGAGAFTTGSSFLANGPNGVISVSPTGGVTTLYSTPGGGGRFVIDPSGGRFGVQNGKQFQTYDGSGNPIATYTVTNPGGFAMFVPNTNLVYIAQIAGSGERTMVTGAQIFSPSGLVASFATPGLRVARVTPTALVYATPTQLVQTTLAGVEVRRLNLAVVTFEVSASGGNLAALLRAPGTSQIVHVNLSTGAATSPTTLAGTFWNLALAPGGRFSAVTTQTGLYVFDTGLLSRTESIPVTWAVSVDVSDQGYVAVGGQNSSQQGQLVLFGPGGTGSFSAAGSGELDAWRPAVRFVPNGQQVMMNGKSGLQAFNIQRVP
jgi:hypothetical protein